MKRYILVITLIILSGVLIYQGIMLDAKADNYDDKLYKRILYYNKITKDKDGLYKDNDTYYFKGTNVNNYIQIFDRLYRIISFTDDNVKIISNKNEAVFYLGDNNINLWLNKNEDTRTGIYYDSISNKEKYLEKIDNNNYFTILDVDSYNNSKNKGSFIDNGESSFIDNDGQTFIKSDDGKVEDKATFNTSSGIRVIMKLKSNIVVKNGSGTYNNPYVIEINNNYINKYVQLGEDMYQVFSDSEGILKLRSNKVLDKKQIFSYSSSLFNPLNKNNIAYYLNNNYYNSLSYKKYLKECVFYTGNLLDDYNYLNIYNSKISVKVGLMNIYDLNISNYLSDYYLINASKDNYNIAFAYDKFGSIISEGANILKKVLPVVCIDRSEISRGNGTLKNPYILE